MPKLKVIFEGLCALHADKPIDVPEEQRSDHAEILLLSRKNGQTAAGLFPDERKPLKRLWRAFRDKKHNADRRLIDPHHSTLDFDYKNYHSFTEKHRKEPREMLSYSETVPTCTKDLIGLIPILYDEIRFDVRDGEVDVKSADKGTLHFHNPPSGIPEGKETGDESWLYWLPKMDKVASGCGMIKDGILTRGIKDKLLTGYITLTEGRLSTYALSQDLWAFKPVDEPDQSSDQILTLTTKLVWEVSIEAEEHIKITLDNKHSEIDEENKSMAELVLKHHGEDIMVRIKNRELEHSLGLTEFYEEEMQPDRDFEAFYTISANEEPRGGRLIPHLANVFPSSSGRPCIPVGFDGLYSDRDRGLNIHYIDPKKQT